MKDASGADIPGQFASDRYGRLLCDLDNRSVQDQVNEAIDLVLNTNPYVLVDNR